MIYKNEKLENKMTVNEGKVNKLYNEIIFKIHIKWENVHDILLYGGKRNQNSI